MQYKLNTYLKTYSKVMFLKLTSKTYIRNSIDIRVHVILLRNHALSVVGLIEEFRNESVPGQNNLGTTAI